MSNAPIVWNTYFATCDRCGVRYRTSDGECRCVTEEDVEVKDAEEVYDIVLELIAEGKVDAAFGVACTIHELELEWKQTDCEWAEAGEEREFFEHRMYELKEDSIEDRKLFNKYMVTPDVVFGKRKRDD